MGGREHWALGPRSSAERHALWWHIASFFVANLSFDPLFQKIS